MGIPTGIKTLLEGNVVEWARIEFKKTWKPEESLRTICAFANDIDNWGGGYLVIGVEEDNGRPVLPVTGVPLEKIDSVLKDILNKCKMIAPSYLPVVAPMEYQGKMLIVAWAPGGEVRPYNSPEDFFYENHKARPTKERVYFIRKMSSTVKPSQDELNELYSLSNKVPFDDRINHEAELSDLNLNLIRQYLTTVGSSMVNDLDSKTIAEICENMVISNNLPEYRKPRNVGLMFFSNEPDKFFPYAQIDVVAFPKGLGGDVIDERTLLYWIPVYGRIYHILNISREMTPGDYMKLKKRTIALERELSQTLEYDSILTARLLNNYFLLYDYYRSQADEKVKRDEIENNIKKIAYNIYILFKKNDQEIR